VLVLVVDMRLDMRMPSCCLRHIWSQHPSTYLERYRWVILGHSERRALMSESNEMVADKTDYALHHGLKVRSMPAQEWLVLDCNSQYRMTGSSKAVYGGFELCKSRSAALVTSSLER